MLHEKRIVITGIANKRSIATAIAKKFSEQGAEVILVCQNERLKSRGEDILTQCNDSTKGQKGQLLLCDCSSDEEIASLADTLNGQGKPIDGLIHSMAFANRDEIKGDFHDVTTRDGFSLAHDISVYSLVALCKALLPSLQKSPAASITTMTYYGSEKAIKNYNVMGVAKASLEATVRYLAQSLGTSNIRVNALSPGPVQTLAAAGIADFSKMLEYSKKNSAMQRDLSTEDIADVALFLASDLSKAISGEIIHVDNGFHAIGISALTQ